MTPPNRGPSLAFDATIGLGSNIGDKAANIDAAITQLTARGDVQLIAASQVPVRAVGRAGSGLVRQCLHFSGDGAFSPRTAGTVPGRRE